MSTFAFADSGEVFLYLESFTNLEREPAAPEHLKLERISRLLNCLGRPDKTVPAIHIAGTKGKGSTAAFISSLLVAAGLRTGMYLSPHVVSYNERFLVDGRPVEDQVLCTQAAKLADSVEAGAAGDTPPTTFELLTTLGFMVFEALGLDAMVIETGIGGRLDATNVISPVISVITPIEIEHTEYLGTTLEQITREKAGIIKPGVPVLVGRVRNEVRRVLRETAEPLEAPIVFLDDLLEHLTCTPDLPRDRVEIRIPGLVYSGTIGMSGAHQAENAALAMLAVRQFRPELPLEELLPALAGTSLPGRFQILPTSPIMVLDSAHTPDSLERTIRTFHERFSKSGILLFGAVEGKNHSGMARVAAGKFSRIVITTPGTFKTSNPENLYRIFREFDEHSSCVPDTREALIAAVGLSGGAEPILITGSFYLAGQIQSLVHGGVPGLTVMSR